MGKKKVTKKKAAKKKVAGRKQNIDRIADLLASKSITSVLSDELKNQTSVFDSQIEDLEAGLNDKEKLPAGTASSLNAALQSLRTARHIALQSTYQDLAKAIVKAVKAVNPNVGAIMDEKIKGERKSSGKVDQESWQENFVKAVDASDENGMPTKSLVLDSKGRTPSVIDKSKWIAELVDAGKIADGPDYVAKVAEGKRARRTKVYKV
jgi:hypothetical protein